MTDHHTLAALCLFGAIVLFSWVVICLSTKDLLPVKLSNKKTWRRSKTSNWGHAVGIAIFASLIGTALALG
jgi:hypothetical protein